MRIILLLFSILGLPCIGICQNSLTIDEQVIGRPIFMIPVDSIKIVDEYGNLDISKCKQWLGLYSINENSVSTFAVIGQYLYRDSVLSFQPTFEMDPNLQFELRYSEANKISYQVNQHSDSFKSEAMISTIFPNSEKIPLNILTFYIEFNKPMIPIKDAYKKVKLFEKNNNEMQNVWRQKSFWINGNKTLVLMIHPGRVKNGIRATSELGDLFEVGTIITMQIMNGLVAEDGSETIRATTKNYTIAELDKTIPKFKKTTIKKPRQNTNDTLQFSFSEVMDYGLVNKWLLVKLDNDTFAGDFISIDGIEWKFVPKKKWISGVFYLVIGSKAGDLCHNQLDRRFEVKKPSIIQNGSFLSYKIRINKKNS